MYYRYYYCRKVSAEMAAVWWMGGQWYFRKTDVTIMGTKLIIYSGNANKAVSFLAVVVRILDHSVSKVIRPIRNRERKVPPKAERKAWASPSHRSS